MFSFIQRNESNGEYIINVQATKLYNTHVAGYGYNADYRIYKRNDMHFIFCTFDIFCMLCVFVCSFFLKAMLMFAGISNELMKRRTRIIRLAWLIQGQSRASPL